MNKQACGKIIRVAEGGAASQAGLCPGDELLSVNFGPMRDILDYRFATSEERFVLEVRRDGRNYACFISKDAEEDLGLEFEEELFDGVHTCNNRCIFCFLHQMPKGLRQTLYVRDDDFRLSFARGNYITLTNLTDEEMDRICSQRMSPIYVSVHATEPDLRARMLRNEAARRVMDQLKQMATSRITMHAQIVLCPEWNDGEHLERTVRDLSELHPWVESVAVVPVGLTRHREGLPPLRTVDADLASEVVESCARWQDEFLEKFGARLVHPSDEFYLLSGIELPDAGAYEGFPQLEDGVGVCRIFLDELKEIAERADDISVKPGTYVLLTGMLAEPLVKKVAEFLNMFRGVEALVCEVRNGFLGETVTVAGLLAGQDIVSALKSIGPDKEVLIPSVALNDENCFLDDMSLSKLEEMVEAKITVVPPSPKAVIEHLAADYMEAVSCTAGAGT